MSKTDDVQTVTKPGFSALKPTPFSQYAGRAREVVGAAIKRAEESLAGSFDGITTDGPEFRREVQHPRAAMIAAWFSRPEGVLPCHRIHTFPATKELRLPF